MKKIIISISLSILMLNSYADNVNNFNLKIPKTNLSIISDEESNDSVDVDLGGGSQTPPDETNLTKEIIKDNDGYNIIYKKDVTDPYYLIFSDWKILRDSATEGFKITTTTDSVIYIPLSEFSVDARCYSFYDESQNDFQGTPLGNSSPENFEIVLYHDEISGCTMGGSDYSFMMISYKRSIFAIYNDSGYISNIGVSRILAKEISIK